MSIKFLILTKPLHIVFPHSTLNLKLLTPQLHHRKMGIGIATIAHNFSKKVFNTNFRKLGKGRTLDPDNISNEILLLPFSLYAISILLTMLPPKQIPSYWKQNSTILLHKKDEPLLRKRLEISLPWCLIKTWPRYAPFHGNVKVNINVLKICLLPQVFHIEYVPPNERVHVVHAPNTWAIV